MAWSGVQPWLASTASLKSAPAARRASLSRFASSSGGEATDLELHPGELRLHQTGHLCGDVGVLGVVATDGDHRDGGPVAAPQAPQGQAERLARTASQMATSTQAVATRPSRRSRRMFQVAGRASSQQRSVANAS
jgi:hypothetical protein